MAAKRKTVSRSAKTGRMQKKRPRHDRPADEILFPLEPPTIPIERIEAAVRAVLAARGKLKSSR